MKYECDMQVHSSYSADGAYTPDVIFARAKKIGLKGLVITDHNVTAGIGPSLIAAKKYKIATLQGIEISTKYKGADIHILGYSTRFDFKVLEKGMKKTIAGYNSRSMAIAKKVNRLKIARVDFKKLLAKTRTFVSKVNIAQIIARQEKITLPQALKFVERGGPAFIPYGQWAMSPEDAVELIHRAGGIAVFAHPGDMFYSRSVYTKRQAKKIIQELLKKLLQLSLDGIEVYYPTHTKKDTQYFISIAKKYNLLVTGGSDWHSEEKNPNMSLAKTGVSFSQFQKIFQYIKNMKQ